MGIYNKKRVRTANVISTLGVLVALCGWWLTHAHVFINLGLLIAGAGILYYNRDLAEERATNYKVDFKVARGMYVLAGAVFVLSSIVWLLSDLV